MSAYLVRRLLQSFVVLAGVTLLSFFVLHMAGDPTNLYVSERASQAEIEKTRHALGFDRPLSEQYFSYIGGLLHGDLGTSLASFQPVTAVLGTRIANSAVLVVLAERLTMRKEYLAKQTSVDALTQRLERATLGQDVVVAQRALELARGRAALLEKRGAAGAAGELEVMKANVELKEREIELQRLARRWNDTGRPRNE